MYKLHETEKPLAPEAKRAAVTVSKIGLDWLGKIITHKNAGQGIVVGYSPVTWRTMCVLLFWRICKPYLLFFP